MSFKSFITSAKHTVSAKSPEICVALGLGALVVAVFTAAKAAPYPDMSSFRTECNTK